MHFRPFTSIVRTMDCVLFNSGDKSDGSGPEWYISSMLKSPEKPFWCRTLEMTVHFRLNPRCPTLKDRLVGLVAQASASRAEDNRFECRLCRDFCGSSHTSDLKIGTPLANLPGAWRYRVSAGTGWPSVSIL